MPDFDVIIVGGGVSGVAAARELATDHDVLVCERDQLAGGATALAAGEVTMTPSYPDAFPVAEHAMQFFRAYDGTGDFSFNSCESIELVTPDREAPARRRVTRLAEKDIPVSFLELETIAEQYPRLDLQAFAGGVRHHDTGFVDPYTFAITLADDAQSRGATIRTNTPVESLCIDDNTVHSVQVDGEQLTTDHVIVAAGWRTPEIVDPYVDLPVRPYRTQCLVLETATPIDGDVPMGWIPGEHVYFRPEQNGDLLIGGWSFAEDNPETASSQADHDFQQHVAELLPKFLTNADNARIADGWAGCDAATPDTRPIIDEPESAPDGLIIATGFHGRGVMTAPVTGTTVRSIITGETPPFSQAQFHLSRFNDRSSNFEFQSISAGD